jgi:hypothetical protein
MNKKTLLMIRSGLEAKRYNEIYVIHYSELKEFYTISWAKDTDVFEINIGKDKDGYLIKLHHVRFERAFLVLEEYITPQTMGSFADWLFTNQEGKKKL